MFFIINQLFLLLLLILFVYRNQIQSNFVLKYLKYNDLKIYPILQMEYANMMAYQLFLIIILFYINNL